MVKKFQKNFYMNKFFVDKELFDEVDELNVLIQFVEVFDILYVLYRFQYNQIHFLIEYDHEQMVMHWF